MKAEQVDIHADPAGYIFIMQDDPYSDDPQCVRITPEQADLVCEWIMLAKERFNEEVDHSVGAI